MAKPKDSVIENCLRKVVRAAVAKDEEITIKQVRGRVENELGLEEGFLVQSDEWKPRSKIVIKDVFAEESEHADDPTPTSNTPAVQTPSDKPAAKSQSQDNVSEAPKSKPTASKGTKSKKPEERVLEDSSSDEESDDLPDESSKKATQKEPQQPKQINGVKRKTGECSTSDEDASSGSSSSSEDSPDTEAPQKKKARKGEPSSSGEESESSSEDELPEVNAGRKSSRSPKDSTPSAGTSIPAIPPKQFVPPMGFTSIDAQHLSAHEALSLSNMDGKQVWHITAPSNLSLSSVTELSLDALRSKQSLFNRDGIDYIANEQLDTNMDTPSVFLATEDGYRVAEERIKRSLHLQQQISLPNLSIRQADQNSGSSAAAQVGASQIFRAKSQPKGLRMRYKPPGFGAGKPGVLGSDSETGDDTETAANTMQNTGLTQDVDEMDMNDGKAHASSNKSKKKHKSTASLESGGSTTNGILKPSPSSANVTTNSQPATINDTSEESLSKEERKRLRRERKEAKQKTKAAVG